jgi:parallel beta-helix repeat protein
MFTCVAKKVIVVCFILLFLGSCVVSTTSGIIGENKNYSINTSNSRKILYVGGNGPCNYTNIQDAIDNASDGDIVYVYSGSYYENIIIDKSISLIGENRTNTIIAGNYTGNPIYVNTSFVIIKNFYIQRGNTSGIRLMNSQNCLIYNNIISFNNKYGISLSQSRSNNISDNIIDVNEIGIKMNYNSDVNTIKNNDILNNYNGIYLESSSENTVLENYINLNEYGIRLYSKSRKNIIEKNHIADNNLGIFIGGTIYPTFAFNILLDGSTKNKIIKNNFLENQQDAFFQNSRRNLWWRNYWNESKILPKLIFGELFICRLQGMPPTAIEHHIPWIPRIDWRPALRPFMI